MTRKTISPARRFLYLGVDKIRFPMRIGNIRDCRRDYRTFGELAPDKSNVIVFLTGADGTTEQAAFPLV